MSRQDEWDENDERPARAPRRREPVPPGQEDAMVRQAATFCSTIERLFSDGLQAMRESQDGTQQMLQRCLEQQLALISPDALRLSATLANNRGPAGQVPREPPQVPRPHPAGSRGLDDTSMIGVSLDEIESDIKRQF